MVFLLPGIWAVIHSPFIMAGSLVGNFESVPVYAGKVTDEGYRPRETSSSTAYRPVDGEGWKQKKQGYQADIKRPSDEGYRPLVRPSTKENPPSSYRPPVYQQPYSPLYWPPYYAPYQPLPGSYPARGWYGIYNGFPGGSGLWPMPFPGSGWLSW